mmetsp:Transcript_1721/g.2472  ORF Transcript_1721/g.2472 Transcript_1721/m.2472 type:complete len:493 (-) Transcript_1721:363-1841(-)
MLSFRSIFIICLSIFAYTLSFSLRLPLRIGFNHNSNVSPQFKIAHGSSFKKNAPLALNSRNNYKNSDETRITTVDKIRALRVRELKSELNSLGITTDDVFEKEELVKRLLQARFTSPNEDERELGQEKFSRGGDKFSLDNNTNRPLEISIPLGYHSLSNNYVTARNREDVFLRPSPGKFISIDLYLTGKELDEAKGYTEADFKHLTLLVDTACSGIVLRPSVASKLALPSYNGGSASMTSAGGTTITHGSIYMLEHMALSTITLEGDITRRKIHGLKGLCLPSVVQEIGPLPQSLDGIIGLSFLERFARVEFDFSLGVLNLVPTTISPPTYSLNQPMKVVATSKLKKTQLGIYLTHCVIDGREVNLVLDTGAGSTILNWNGLKQMKLDKDHPLVARITESFGAMGADNFALPLTHRFAAKTRFNLEPDGFHLGMELGNDVLNVDIGDLPILNQLQGEGAGGILGSDFLMRSDILRIDGLDKNLPSLFILMKT